MGTIAASLDRLSHSMDSLEAAVTTVAERLADRQTMTDPAVADRHARLREEVSAAIAELDQLIGANGR